MSQSKVRALLASILPDLGTQDELIFSVNVPPRQELGDFASNVAILAARQLKKNPLDIARTIADKSKTEKIFAKVEVAKPGFVNFFLTDEYLQNNVLEIQRQDQDYGRVLNVESRALESILLEFVSANPTGPLHVGHGRWAVVGDVIARLLRAAGHKVATEFYVNNMGKQIELLLASVKARREGKAVPEGGYGGSYIAEVKGESREEILNSLISQQKRTLDNLGVKFDNWFAESELHKKNELEKVVARLKEVKVTFEEEGSLWFHSEKFGDDKNRVLIRADGQPTYFAADVAYHFDKFERGYDQLIDIWGTDHHGYVRRVKSAMQALGKSPEKLEIIIGQLVTLYRGDESVRMSKRTGEMVTLQEVLDEIGADAARFFFAASAVNTHLDFDLELARKQTNDNPVYYVQYAHARICSILRKCETENLKLKTRDLASLEHPAERELMFKLLTWPDVVLDAADKRLPHRITEYGKELATVFHSFYEKCKVLGSPARLALVDASRITLRNVLELLGISSPEKM